MSNSTAQIQPLNESDSDETAVTATTSPRTSTEIKWEIVARTPGLTNATIIAGRLHAENIPVRAWQEGAGQAMGLTIGLLGTGFVAVPEEYADQALDILEDEEE